MLPGQCSTDATRRTSLGSPAAPPSSQEHKGERAGGGHLAALGGGGHPGRAVAAGRTVRPGLVTGQRGDTGTDQTREDDRAEGAAAPGAQPLPGCSGSSTSASKQEWSPV